jgi:hypothetical protein
MEARLIAFFVVAAISFAAGSVYGRRAKEKAVKYELLAKNWTKSEIEKLFARL